MGGRRLFSIFVAAMLAGCVSSHPVDPNIERIAFEPMAPPFCGRCESTKFVVGADGVLRIETGYYAGHYRDWRRHREVRRVTPDQFADFKARLAPYREEANVVIGEAGCRKYHTDDAGLRVEWVSGSERRVRIFDFGCEDDPALNKIVLSAPGALGLSPRF